MDCFFINLDAAVGRRRSLEENFARFAGLDWRLRRFSAVSAEQAARRSAGGLRDPEKGCFLSHLDLLRSQASAGRPFLVLEDDACFGPNSCATIERSVAHLEHAGEWDLLFPEIGVPQAGTMFDLLMMRRELLARGRTRLLDPAKLAFFSATAYVIHPRAIPKVLTRAEANALDAPYDLFLRQLICEGALTARVIFPFATSIAAESDVSAIQSASTARTDQIWNLFRRMVWRDGAIEPHLPALADLSRDRTTEAKAYAIIWAAMADPSFKPK